MSRLYAIVCLGMLVTLLVAGCSPKATPQMIASYPSSGRQEGPAPGYVTPLPAYFVYDAYLEMEVADPASSADRAADLAYSYGGYLVSSQSWYRDGREHLTAVLAVPVGNYESLRRSILRLGKLLNEQVSGHWVNPRDGSEWTVYSQITVRFQPRPYVLPVFFSTGWHPADTFARALGVFLNLFGFLADILIWLLVVVGPFVLIGWGLWKLGHRLPRTK